MPTLDNWQPSYASAANTDSKPSSLMDWQPSYIQSNNNSDQPENNPEPPISTVTFAGIEGFEGEPRTENVLENIGLDLKDLANSYKMIGGLIADDFASGNYTKTLGKMVKEFPEAIVKSYTRWKDAYDKGVLGEAIQKYPLQFAQDVSLPATFLLGGTGAVLKGAGIGGNVAKAVNVMSKVADAVEIASDPIVGAPVVIGRKVAGKVFRDITGKTPRVPESPKIETSLEKETLQSVFEEKGYANASKLADDVLDNPELLKDPDIYSDYTKMREKLAPEGIDFKKAAKEILDKDLEAVPASKKYIVNQNIQRLGTTYEMDNLTQAMADALEKEKSPTRTWANNDEKASAIGMNVEDMLKIPPDKALSSYQIEAARRVNQEALFNLYATKNIAKQAPTPENLLKFDRALRVYSATFDKMSGITTEAGRALQIFNKIPKIEKLKQKAIRELIEQHGGFRKIEETMRIMDELSDDQINRFVRQTLEATNWEKFREGWMSAMLSGPTTHVVNAGSNAATTAYAQVFESLSTNAVSGVGNAVRKIAGKETTPVRFAETVGRIKGLGRGMIAGAKAAKKNFLTGETFGINLPLEYRMEAIKGFKGKVIRTPLKLLESSDSFFKALNYTSELEGLAVRDGVKRGLKGKELSSFVRETLISPPDGLIDQAMKVAEKNTYTNKLGGDWLTESGKWIMAGRSNKYFGKPLQIIIPFVRTPTNIMKFALDRTPIAFTFADVRKALRAGGVARDQALGRIMLGTSLSFYIANQVSDGKITGALSSDQNKRDTQRAAGIQPYSFHVGDNYYSYQRMEPLGTIIGLTSDFTQLFNELSGPETEANKKELEKIPAYISASISQNVLNKTYMQGLSGLVSALDDPDRFFERFYSNLFSTAIPTGVAQAARADDPYLREARTAIQRIINRIPRLRQTLPYRYNIWGEPIKIETSYSFVNPIYKSSDKNDKSTNEMLRLGVFPGMPSDRMTIAKNKVKLNKEQYNVLLDHSRRRAKEIIDSYTQSRDWDYMTDLEKRATIEKIIQNYDRRGRSVVRRLYAEELINNREK